MTVTQLPNKRWRAQVWDARIGKSVSVAKVLGLKGQERTFSTKTEAKKAREKARLLLGDVRSAVTVMEWWERWTTDPLFERPKASTNIHNRERTKAFAKAHAKIPLAAVDSSTVSLWLAGGKRNGQVPALRVMFNDAIKPLGGELIARNPWAGLGLQRSTGNATKHPPSEAEVRLIIQHAEAQTFPAFAAWLQVAAYTGLRPGELDALRWDDIDFATGRITIRWQWSAGSRSFTLPKNGHPRPALLTPPARQALLALPRQSEFCFTTLRGTHFTPSSRSASWGKTRAASGWTGTLYLATRHFAGWYMRNILELTSEDTAIVLGHTDGGELVRRLYGHLDDALALRRAQRAFDDIANAPHETPHDDSQPLRKLGEVG